MQVRKFLLCMCSTCVTTLKSRLSGGDTQTSVSFAWIPCITASVLCAQLCPTLCGPMDCNAPGSSVCGISQAKILEWVLLLQGIFLLWQVDPLPLAPPGKSHLAPSMGIFTPEQFQGEDKNPFVPNFQGKRLKANLGEGRGWSWSVWLSDRPMRMEMW